MMMFVVYVLKPSDKSVTLGDLNEIVLTRFDLETIKMLQRQKTQYQIYTMLMHYIYV